jgi:hypothetical protein
MTPVAPSPIAPPLQAQSPSDFADPVEACLTRTAAALGDARIASQQELFRALDVARRSHLEGMPADLLETVLRGRGHEEEHFGGAIRQVAGKLAASMDTPVPLIPFAGKLIAPSAFYDSFTSLHQTARSLLAPVIFAEDTDSIGVASINPVAAIIMGEIVQQTVFRRFGIRPFVTLARLDYESWTFLNRRHFGL